MARGFKSIDQELGWLHEGKDIGDFIQIDYGTGTGWSSLCEYSRSDGPLWIVFKRPVSYRVHDEREIVAYWHQRSEEGAPYAFAYEIEESAYLDELRTGVSGAIHNCLRHFLTPPVLRPLQSFPALHQAASKSSSPARDRAPRGR